MSKKLSTQEKARRAWARALRSKQYGWGKAMLRPEQDKFCCLGVLCEVAFKHGVISSYESSHGDVPKVVQKWVGMQTPAGQFYAPHSSNDSLVALNDRASRNPFSRIANLIERKPDGLFVDEVA